MHSGRPRPTGPGARRPARHGQGQHVRARPARARRRVAAGARPGGAGCPHFAARRAPPPPACTAPGAQGAPSGQPGQMDPAPGACPCGERGPARGHRSAVPKAIGATQGGGRAAGRPAAGPARLAPPSTQPPLTAGSARATQRRNRKTCADRGRRPIGVVIVQRTD